MLVLARRKGERIIIGEGASQVILEVVECQEHKVKLGFAAPPEIPVHREEVYRAIHDAPLPPAKVLPQR